MIQYSFSTVLMAFLSCAVIIVFVAVCFCNKKLLVTMGYKMFALLLGLTFIRLLFPIQFPFAINVVLPDKLSQIVAQRIRHSLFMIGSLKISPWRIFEFIWVFISIVLLIKFIADQMVFRRTIILYGKDITYDERYSKILGEVCGDRPNRFRIIEIPGFEVPVLNGIFSPCILMPEDLKLSDVDLRYLLSHEVAHHFHRDIITKIGINLLAIVYWWNPASYMLKGQLNAILEMRIDSYVTGNISDEIAGYLNCLIHIAEYTDSCSEKRFKIPKGAIELLNPKRIEKIFNNLKNRFYMMSEDPKPYAKVLHITVLIVTVALYILSYCFIFEARSFIPESDATTVDFDVTNDKIYAILKEDDTYDVYYGGFLIDTTTSLEYYPPDIFIYNSLDEVPEELYNYFAE